MSDLLGIERDFTAMGCHHGMKFSLAYVRDRSPSLADHDEISPALE